MSKIIMLLITIFSAVIINAERHDNLLLGISGKTDTVVKGNALGHSDKYEQPLWLIKSPRNIRTDDFRPDSVITTGSALLADCRGSGYDPAATMGAKQTLGASYYLAMSPQEPNFNRGIWKRFEYQMRASDSKKKGYVVSAPSIKHGYKTIVKDTVITQYYSPTLQKIDFSLKNKGSSQASKNLAVTVDSLDFFSGLPDVVEAQLESQSNIDQSNSNSPSLKQETTIKEKAKNDLTLPVKYVASKKSKVFHRPNCSYVQKIADYNKIEFRDRNAAIDSGRRPCKKCRP